MLKKLASTHDKQLLVVDDGDEAMRNGEDCTLRELDLQASATRKKGNDKTVSW